MIKSIEIFLFFYLISSASSKTAAEWRSRSIYQMLTDRFSPSHYSYTRCLENPPVEKSLRHYCGGTYRGAIDQLDYIRQLGFNALWISPIPSNTDKETIYGVGWHGYWQNNISKLNEHFGSAKDLIALINEAHRRDIWIMLDVVANHVGPNVSESYFPFNKPEHYHQPPCVIEDDFNQTQVEFCSLGGKELPLPDLNTENPFVISTLLKWISETVNKYQIDGIRIDTFRHVRQSFWEKYRKSAGVYSIGEVASSNTSFVGSYQRVADGILHYPLYFVLNSTFTDDDQSRQTMFLLEKQVKQNEKYFKDSTLCGVFLDNHDRNRFLSSTQNPRRIENALVYLMFSDGIPILYMGTEQNFTGNPNVVGGATDPWNREPLWKSNYDRSNWIFQYIAKLNRIRSQIKRHYGEQFFISHQKTIFIDNNTYAYQKGRILIVVSNEPFASFKSIPLPSGLKNFHWQDLLSNRIVRVNGRNELRINNWNPMILVPVA